MSRRAVNQLTGQEYELRGGQWQEVTPTPAQRAARDSSALETFGVNAVSSVRQIGLSLEDAGLALGQLLPGVNQEYINELRAAMQVESARESEYQEATSAQNPVAGFAGKAAPFIAGAALPGGQGLSAARLIGAEAAIGAGGGFFSRPGSMADRVREAAAGAAFGAAGGGFGAAASSAFRSGAKLLRPGRAVDDVNGTVDLELGPSDIELEMVTGVPRFGEAAQREYQRLASVAPVADSLSDYQKSVIAKGDSLGFAFTDGQRTNNTSLQRIEASLKSNPMTAGPFDELGALNRRRYQDYAADALDVYDDARPGQFTQEMMGEAIQKIDEGYNQVARDLGTVEVDDLFSDKLRNIEYVTTTPGERAPVKRFIEQIREFAGQRPILDGGGNVTGYEGGQMSGRQLMDLRRSMANETSKLHKSADLNSMAEVHRIVDAVDALILRQTEGKGGRQIAQDYRALRDKWRLWNAIDTTKAVSSKGELSFGKLNRSLETRYPKEYRRSGLGNEKVLSKTSRVMDATKVLTAFPDIVGDSGTATRLFSALFADQPVRSALKGIASATTGRAAFNATRSRAGARLMTEGLDAIEPASDLATVLGAGAGAGAARESTQ